jgi:hypothetical protein
MEKNTQTFYLIRGIKVGEMGWTYSTDAGVEKCIVGQPQLKRSCKSYRDRRDTDIRVGVG